MTTKVPQTSTDVFEDDENQEMKELTVKIPDRRPSHTLSHDQANAPFPGAILRHHDPTLETEKEATSLCDDLAPIIRSSLIELFGSIILEVISLSIVITSIQLTETPVYPIALLNGLLLTLLIFAFAAPSGAHLNPMITLATTFCGMCEIRRCIGYFIAQFCGSTIGALLLRIGMNNISSSNIKNIDIGGCYFGDIPDFNALILEFCFSLLIIALAFGVAFDPRQGEIYGQFAAPWFIGIGVAMGIFASSGLKVQRQYIGAGMNPSRCFGPAMATLDFNKTWIYIIAPLLAAILHAPIYNLIPPHHAIDFTGKNKMKWKLFRFKL